MNISPWVCRLYPEPGSSLYARVQVWPTKRAMLQHLRTGGYVFARGHVDRRTEGTCSRVDATMHYPGGRAQKRPCFACVNLYRGRLTMRVVTHELFHATIAWGHRVRFPFAGLDADEGVTESEERITHVHGEMCSQFMHKASVPGAPYAILGRIKSA